MSSPHSNSNDETGSASGSDSDSGSFELPDPLATGREKRQTAGNRLRDMLNAELEAEEIFAEDEEDIDFGSDQDKQDDLDSEFGSSSTDEGAIAEPEDAGERLLRKQEKEAARAKKRKAAEAFSKPPEVVSPHEKQPRKMRKRLIGTDAQQRQRQSSRAHAVKVKSALERKLEEKAARKASHTPFIRVEEHIMTQEERLAEARITEEENVQSLNKIVKYDEERKATQKMLAQRRRHIGPVLRFVSSSKKSSDADDREIKNEISFHHLTPSMEDVPVLERLLGPGMREAQLYPVKPVCAITGTPALYRDPATGIAFGDSRAYAILQRLYRNEICWNSTLQLYIYNVTTAIQSEGSREAIA